MPKATVLFQTVDALGRVTFDFAGRILTDLLNIRARLTGAEGATTKVIAIVDDITGQELSKREIYYTVARDVNGNQQFQYQENDILEDATGQVLTLITKNVRTAGGNLSAYASLEGSVRTDNSGLNGVAFKLMDTKGKSTYLRLANGTEGRSLTGFTSMSFASSATAYASTQVYHGWNTTKVVAVATPVIIPGQNPGILYTQPYDANNVTVGVFCSNGIGNPLQISVNYILWETP